MLPMKNLKNTRAITYRRYGIPALILEGKWLTEKYRLLIGDVVDIDYQPKEIRLKKNLTSSKERQQMLKDKKEIRRQRIYELNKPNDYKTGDQENPEGQSTEYRERTDHSGNPR